jgi:hypothetical protein
MAGNLYGVFTCVRMRGTENGDKHVVDDITSGILDGAVVDGVGEELGFPGTVGAIDMGKNLKCLRT